jgi:hypothetical protein
MSVSASVDELKSLRAEVKLLNKKRRKINDRIKVLEAKFEEFCKAKNIPGVKNNGEAIRVEEKEVPGRKKEKDKDNDTFELLKKEGIENPKDLWEKIKSARQGELVSKKKVDIKKIK